MQLAVTVWLQVSRANPKELAQSKLKHSTEHVETGQRRSYHDSKILTPELELAFQRACNLSSLCRAPSWKGLSSSLSSQLPSSWLLRASLWQPGRLLLLLVLLGHSEGQEGQLQIVRVHLSLKPTATHRLDSVILLRAYEQPEPMQPCQAYGNQNTS